MIDNESMISSKNMYPYGSYIYLISLIYTCVMMTTSLSFCFTADHLPLFKTESTSPKASNTVPKLTALRGTWDGPVEHCSADLPETPGNGWLEIISVWGPAYFQNGTVSSQKGIC